MAKKIKKQDVIKPKPDEREVCIDYSFMHSVTTHAHTFGLPSVLINIVEAYRSNARKYNKEAERIEQALEGN